MGIVAEDAVNQFEALMNQVDEPLKKTFQNIHQGYPTGTLVRFLKAREWNVPKAHKMLVDCLNWRVENDIDNILAKPIVPTDLYRGVRDSQLIGLSGYTKEGLPVFAIGAGFSTFDKASVHYYVQSHIQINEYRDRVILVLDMTGLKLSALSQIKLLTIMSTIDDLNYPEKTNTYYIVVKPLLQERTRKKIQVLPGCGRDELLKAISHERTSYMLVLMATSMPKTIYVIMDYASLPHFCRREGSGSSRHSGNETDNCYTLDHPFHQQLYNYIKEQASIIAPAGPYKQGSIHVHLPESAVEESEIAKTIESELQKFGNQTRLTDSLDALKVSDNRN
ncbi:hypothetical protein CK203_026946 [Vitis vinifera]|uniref:CRAL-TRIO domain-containing protein n=1 Tax=Vitis vinifera TaxID=29760 RepID=A0A438HRZ4_VITVI|nr:hypothetical protein CK203_026946 [Vitis vinifera]